MIHATTAEEIPIDDLVLKAKKIVPVMLCGGKFAYFCCADCDFSVEYDSNRNQYYCGHYGRWMDGNDRCDIERRNTD